MPRRSEAGLWATGVFPNGIAASAVVQFILDHDESARVEDVAAYFDLSVQDIAAAIDYCARHLDRLQAQGHLLR